MAAASSPPERADRFSVRWVAQVDSTNTRLKALARAGAPDGFCLCADEQTAGRGQHGRVWYSPPGLGLYLSILQRIVPAPEHLGRVTTFAGLMVYGALAETLGEPTRLRLKAPNDVLLDGRKVAGVLVEVEWQQGKPDFLVIGVGINIGHMSFPDGLRYPATSLRLALGDAAPTREVVLWHLLTQVQTHWTAFLAAPATFTTNRLRSAVFSH